MLRHSIPTCPPPASSACGKCVQFRHLSSKARVISCGERGNFRSYKKLQKQSDFLLGGKRVVRSKISRKN